jgi:hypothetical protein
MIAVLEPKTARIAVFRSVTVITTCFSVGFWAWHLECPVEETVGFGASRDDRMHDAVVDQIPEVAIPLDLVTDDGQSSPVSIGEL